MPLHPLPIEYIIPHLPMASHIGPREYAVTRSNETPQSLPLALATPGIPYLDPHEYASPAPMRYQSPFPLFH